MSYYWLQIIGLILDMFGVYWMSRGLLLNDETIKAMSAKDDTIFRAQHGQLFSNSENLTLKSELIKNRKLARDGLILIGFGFLFQLVAIIIQIKIYR